MIKEYAIFTVGELKLEVNWEPDVIPCKKIKLIHPHGEGILDRDELMGIIMLFGNDQEQESLVTVTRRAMVKIERMLHIKATKDLKKGELITVPYQYFVSREDYDGLVKENPRQYRMVDEEPLSTEGDGTGGQVERT